MRRKIFPDASQGEALTPVKPPPVYMNIFGVISTKDVYA